MALGRNNDDFISDYLTMWAQSLIDEVRGNLVSKDAWYDRSTLAQSINALPVENDGTGFTVQIEMNDYGTFVDEGRSSTKSSGGNGSVQKNLEGASGWIARRGIALPMVIKVKRQTKNGIKFYERRFKNKIEANRSLSFAISHKVHKYGYKAKGYGFWSEIVNDAKINELAEALANQFGERFDITVITEE